MNKKLLLIAAIFVASILTAKSQTVQIKEEAPPKLNAYKTSWIKNRFKDTWFISLGAGGQLLMAEDDNKGDMTKNITLAPSFTIGKYFSPIWGLKMNVTGGTLKGYNDGWGGKYRKWDYLDGNEYPELATWDPQWTAMGLGEPGHPTDPDNSPLHWGDGDIKAWRWTEGAPGPNQKLYTQEVKYVTGSLSFMFDFLTLVGNYNPRRIFDLTPSLGVSVFHTFDHLLSGTYTGLGTTAGLQAKVRLGSKVKWFVEGNLAAYPEIFDGHYGDNVKMDFVAQGITGLTFDLGKNTWEVCEPANYRLIEDLNTQINVLREQLEDCKNTPKDCPPMPEAPTVSPEIAPTEVPQTVVNFLPDAVFFRLDKSIIDPSEWGKIEKAVSYLNNHPEANVVVTGYADRKTAHPTYNMKLSERRSKTVSRALVEKYGISPRRISINWEGDRVQPFSINEWNRVVIFVLE